MKGAVAALIFAAVFWFAGTVGLVRGKLLGGTLAYLLATALVAASFYKMT